MIYKCIETTKWFELGKLYRLTYIDMFNVYVCGNPLVILKPDKVDKNFERYDWRKDRDQKTICN